MNNEVFNVQENRDARVILETVNMESFVNSANTVNNTETKDDLDPNEIKPMFGFARLLSENKVSTSNLIV